MKIEEQMCSLELAKRLKEMGVKQESLFHWMDSISIQFFTEPKEVDRPKYTLGYLPTHLVNTIDHFSAFTASELGEILPIWTDSVKREKEDWYIRFTEKDSIKNHHSFGETEANARAKMLIHLIENKLIEIPNG